MDLQERVPLARYSTLHVGGEARYFVRVATLPHLREALAWAHEKNMRWFVLGGGSNFFCRDGGFQGLALKMENQTLTFGNGEVTAHAGVVTRLLVAKTVEVGLRGIERLAGIPGTVGGSVRGNAGSFGVETKDVLTRVHVLRRATDGWTEDVLPRDQLFFAYRDSTVKREPERYVVWSATFALEAGDRAEGERIVREDLAARKAKQPYEFPSVGSVFKNPSPEKPAGRLIEAAGLKGLRVGGAEVSSKHANFIVNRGGARATEVVALVNEVKRRVLDATGIRLEEEIVILGAGLGEA